MWPQGSQDAYYQNYYGQIYNRSNYNPNPQNPYYPNGGYGYGNQILMQVVLKYIKIIIETLKLCNQ